MSQNKGVDVPFRIVLVLVVVVVVLLGPLEEEKGPRTTTILSRDNWYSL
jgi:hypothetical protein